MQGGRAGGPVSLYLMATKDQYAEGHQTWWGPKPQRLKEDQSWALFPTLFEWLKLWLDLNMADFQKSGKVLPYILLYQYSNIDEIIRTFDKTDFTERVK